MNYVDTRDQLVNIAQIIRRCPTITLMRAYTRAYRDWAMQTQYMTVQIPGVTEANVPLYFLGSDPYLEIVAINGMQCSLTVNGNPQIWPVTPSDSTLWNPAIGPNPPRTYCYVPQAQFALNPTPDQVYDLLVAAVVQPKEGAVQIPETGLTKYRSGIEAGAMAYLHSIPGQTWSNPQQAEFRRREFESSINNARAEVQRSFNTGSVRIRPRAFVR